jgi:hypothetical protein
VLSVIPHPELHSGLVLLEQRGGGKSLARVRHTGEVVILVGTLPAGARSLVLGYGHSVFVVGDDGIQHLEAHGGSAHRVAAAAWPGEMAGLSFEAATYNFDSQELLVISGRHNRLFALDPASLALKAAYTLVPPFSRGRVRSVTAWGHPQGQLVAALDDRELVEVEYRASRPSARRALPAPVHRLVLPGVQDPLSVDVDGGGRLYVADRRAGVREFVPRGGHGWRPAAEPLYARFALAGRQFAVFKSRSNLRPGLHDTPEWDNIPAEELIPLGPVIPDPTPTR